jgi:uncharacterized membrane protein
MSYDHDISHIVEVTGAVGAGIMILGGLGAFAAFTYQALHAKTVQQAYETLRRNLGRCILLGLEVLIIADIVRTIIVDTSIESVGALGIIVIIRTLLSFSLEVEIDGVWPWSRWQLTRLREADTSPGKS